MVLQATRWIFLSLYFAAPVAAMVIASARGRKGSFRSTSRFLFTVFAGALLGTAGTVAYALSLHGRASLGQIALTMYFATAMLCVLRGFDALVKLGLHYPSRRLADPLAERSAAPEERAVERPASGAAKPKPFVHPVLAGFLRFAALIVIGMPYIVSTVMTYRPKVVPSVTPVSLYGFDYTPVEFTAIDGTRLSGWWIPAARRSLSAPSADFGTKTVLVCHGTGGNKSTQLVLAKRLVPAGYNAFVFDFRGNGESGGSQVSFGDLERRDVLGAVRWLRERHPRQSRRIVAVGASSGGAALIAAAADPSDEGQAIEAIAVYGTFADLPTLARKAAHNAFLPPVDWLVAHIGLPLASAQVGTNLTRFSPATYVKDLWPRPILVIHGMRDEIIPFEQGEKLFDAASFPKQHLWLPFSGHRQAIEDQDAADAVREFFESARPMPVI